MDPYEVLTLAGFFPSQICCGRRNQASDGQGAWKRDGSFSLNGRCPPLTGPK